MCPTKVNFDWSSSEIVWKWPMADLLFCTMLLSLYINFTQLIEVFVWQCPNIFGEWPMNGWLLFQAIELHNYVNIA